MSKSIAYYLAAIGSTILGVHFESLGIAVGIQMCLSSIIWTQV